MSTQGQLWHDCLRDAIGADVAALGGVKKVAARLWPAIGVDTAANRLRACLSIEHQQKLDPDELLHLKQLARDAGAHHVVDYEARLLGYRVEWLDPAEEAEALRRDLREELRRLHQRLDQIERTDKRVQTVGDLRMLNPSERCA